MTLSASHTGAARRVLLRAPNWLGDNVLAAPAVRAVRAALPQAHLGVLVRDVMADFWRMLPVDEIIAFPPARGWRGVARRWHTARRVRAAQFASAVVLPNSFDSAFVPWLAGVPQRAGWATDGRLFLLNRRIPFPHDLDGASQAKRYVYLLEQWLGQPLHAALNVRLTAPQDAHARVEAACAGQPRIRLALNPGATYGTAKCWLPARFAEIA